MLRGVGMSFVLLLVLGSIRTSITMISHSFNIKQQGSVQEYIDEFDVTTRNIHFYDENVNDESKTVIEERFL